MRLSSSVTLLALFILLPAPSVAQCFDYGDPGGAPAMTHFDLFPDGEINDFVLAGDIAWVARSIYGALVAVDLSYPAQPVVLGTEPVTVMDETYDVDVSGLLAFVTYLQWGGVAGVRIFDISDPTQPMDVGDIPAPPGRWASYVAAVGDLVYVSFSYDTFGVVDVSNPAAPVLKGQVAVDSPWRITVAGDLAYVSSSNSNPVIIDVSDPTAPAVLGNLTTSGGGKDVAIVGDLAYVTTQTALDVIDITDPLHAVVLGTVALPNIPYEVSVVGDVAYATCHSSGVKVVDVRDPAAPIIHGTVDVPGFPYSSSELGDRLVINTNGTLVIAPAQCPLDVTGVLPVPAPPGPTLTARPNPFNPRTTVAFELARPARAVLVIHDLTGRKVRTLVNGEVLPAGPQQRTWTGLDDTGRPVPSGVYHCRLLTGDRAVTQTITLVR